MNSLTGFGGCLFERNGTEILFEYGRGKIVPSPITGTPRDNIDRKLVQRLLGFRNTLPMELYATNGTEVEKFRSLASMINSMINPDAQETITVYPRYDVAADINQSYECILASDFALDDLANVPVGQKLTLTFVAVNMNIIPTNTSESSLEYWVDELGNEIVDEEGNNIILKGD